jgi:TetR/AcrR family transcriptional repressor of nem operon
MSVRRTCDLSESCALQSLTPEVARADHGTRTAYEAELLRVAEAIAQGLPNGPLAARRKTAWAILAMLSGGVSMARSAADPKTGAQIAAGIKGAAMALTRGG